MTLATATKASPYQFNGKETLGFGYEKMIDFGARNYMADIGRFGVIDPMADFVNYQSPYVMSDNNPVLNVDEYGLGILNAIGNLFKRLANGIANIGVTCECNKRTEQESLGDAFRRSDPSLNPFGGGSNSKPTPSPPPTGGEGRPVVDPIDNINPAGIAMNTNNIQVPEINIPAPRFSFSIDNNRLLEGNPINISVRFESNSEKLKSDASNKAINDKTLNDLLKTLTDYPHIMLLIQGDVSNKNNPTWQEDTDIRINDGRGTVGQLQLSRAKAIKKFLVKRGIDPNRLSVGKGVIDKGTQSATLQSR
jgi:RHS repeat-associated protein